MNYDLERMKLAVGKMRNTKALMLIPALCLLLFFLGLQAIPSLLAESPFPPVFFPLAKILWLCITICGFMGLLVFLGTPRLAKKYEQALTGVLSKVATDHSDESKPLAILTSVERTERGIILAFLSDRLSADDYIEHQSKLEVALNLNIIEICRGKSMRHVLIKAIPANNKEVHIIPWSNAYLSKEDFTLVLGQTPFGLECIDISTTPHLLIGGGSGSGKSLLCKLVVYQCILKNAIVHIADMKGGLDFSKFFHENCNIITDGQKFLCLLEDILSLMEDRRHLLVAAHTPNIAEYNKQASCPLPRTIVVCDEIAEILDKKGLNKEQKEHVAKIESALSTIARQGRAFGIHLLLSTQRPDSEILSGQIRTNVLYRVCGRADKILSQIILDDNSAADKIPPDAQGLFCTNMNTLFKAFYLDESQL